MPEKHNEIETWEHILLRPCYANYMIFRHVPLRALHDKWTQYTDNYDSIDLEVRVQAWQNIMALQRCFRERLEWDSKKRYPKPIKVKEVTGKPMWITNDLKPGTATWLEHWKAFPKEQLSMARHALRLKEQEAKNV